MEPEQTTSEKIKELISDEVIKAIEDLQERYDCFIYLDRDDIELRGSDEFYDQILKNITKHRFE